MRQVIKPIRRKLVRLTVVLVIVGGGALLAWSEPAALLQFRELTWDRFIRLKPRPYDPALQVALVDIDEASLAAHGQWPWSRSRIARLVDALADRGARAVVFDVFFAEPDRTSLGRVFEQLQRDLPDYRPPLDAAALAAQPDNDALLATALGRLPVVLGVTVNRSGQAAGRHRLERLPQVEFESRRDQRFLPVFDGAVASLPALQLAAAANGSLDMITDPDGITRRVNLLYRIDRRTVPALAAAAVAVLGDGPIEAASRRPGLASLTIGGHRVPTDRYGRMRLYDSGTVRARYVSAGALLDGTLAGDRLAGAIAVVGTGAEGLGDLRLTPLDRWVPGMETHAQAIEQILSGVHLQRPDWARATETALIGAAGLLLLVATWFGWARLPPWLVALAVGTLFAAVTWFAFAGQRLLLDPVLPAASLLLAGAAERLLLIFELRRERAEVRSAFSRYLSPALVEQLAAEPERLKLGGERREMTFLFCDVRGFTAISERFKADPQGLTRLINRFLTPLTDAILACRGTIDKYMGDCIMAFWNAPLGDPEHARHAADAALAMLKALERINADLAAEAAASGREGYRIDVGIGLNTGACVVGNMGSEQRFDYSVLGDAVNLASRLEGQSKYYGVTVVIGEETAAALADHATLELDRIAVKGRSTAARIHALLGDATLAADPAFRALLPAHDQLLAAYRARAWPAARAALARCRNLAAGVLELDRLYRLYEARITEFETAPPDPEWDGVYVALTK